MIMLISGASHTGKTVLAQKLLEKYHVPYLSIDHLKMGLIRSGQTALTPSDDDDLTEYLWPIVRELVKTAIENNQNLIVEGCYIPFDWAHSFEKQYWEQIRYICLVMSAPYIQTHFDEICAHANDAEQRLDDSDLTAEWLIEENRNNLQLCKKFGCQYHLIDEDYDMRKLTEAIQWDT